jgi:hypothetical protein
MGGHRADAIIPKVTPLLFREIAIAGGEPPRAAGAHCARGRQRAPQPPLPPLCRSPPRAQGWAP